MIRSRILVVDDDPIFLTLVENNLEQAGYSVDTFANSAKAMEALQHGYDAAIIDLVMPQIDGFRMIAMIRSTSAIKDLPIIVMSSRTDRSAFDEAYRLGVNGFETKPVNWPLFALRLKHVIETCQKIEALKVQAGQAKSSSVH